MLSTGGGGVSNVNLNATYSEQYNWNDANRDLVFQPGEQTGTPVITRVERHDLTSIDPDFNRPYTDEFSRRRRPPVVRRAQVERGVHVSPRKEPPGERQSGQPVRDHADDAPSIPASTA